MSTLILVPLVLFFAAVGFTVGLYFAKRTLKAALSSLLGMLGTLIAAMVAPSFTATAKADFVMKIGQSFSLENFQISSEPPTNLWYVVAWGLIFLIAYTPSLVANEAKAEQ